jgi:hypothetical protein
LGSDSALQVEQLECPVSITCGLGGNVRDLRPQGLIGTDLGIPLLSLLLPGEDGGLGVVLLLFGSRPPICRGDPGGLLLIGLSATFELSGNALALGSVLLGGRIFRSAKKGHWSSPWLVGCV